MSDKFDIPFDISLTGEDKIGRFTETLVGVIYKIEAVSKAADKLNAYGSAGAFAAGEMTKGLRSVGEEKEKLGGSKIDSLMGLHEAVALTSKLHSGMMEVVGAVKDQVQGIIKESATFEDIMSGMKFAFGNKADSVFEQVKKDAADLTFTLQEVGDLAKSLGTMKINPFGGVTAESQLFKSKTGENIRALSVLQDTADAAGKKTEDLTIAIRNAMGGQWTSLATRFDIPKVKINEWRKSIDKLAEPQAKYNKLVEELAKMFGGAGALKTDNFNKITAQLPDLLQQLKGATGAEGLKVITQAIKEVVIALTDLVKDKTVTDGLSNAFMLIANSMAFGIRAGADLIRTVQSFLKLYPEVPKYALGFLAVGTAATVATTAILGVVTAAIALGGVVAAIGLSTFLVGALVVVPAVAATFVALGMAVTSAIAIWQMFDDNAESTTYTMENIRLVFNAVREAINNWGTDTVSISHETNDALKKAGMLETFGGVIRMLSQIESFIDGVAKGFRGSLKGSMDSVKVALVSLIENLEILGRSFGYTIGSGRQELDSAASAGEAFGAAVGGALKFVVDLTADAINVVADLSAGFQEVAEDVSDIYVGVVLVKNGIAIAGNFIGAMLMIPLEFVLNVVLNIFNVLKDIATLNFGKIWDHLTEYDSSGFKFFAKNIGDDLDNIEKAETRAGKLTDKAAQMAAHTAQAKADLAARKEAEEKKASAWEALIPAGMKKEQLSVDMINDLKAQQKYQEGEEAKNRIEKSKMSAIDWKNREEAAAAIAVKPEGKRTKAEQEMYLQTMQLRGDLPVPPKTASTPVDWSYADMRQPQPSDEAGPTISKLEATTNVTANVVLNDRVLAEALMPVIKEEFERAGYTPAGAAP